MEKIEFNRVKQQMRNREMDNLASMMNELDFTSPSAFPMLFAFK